MFSFASDDCTCSTDATSASKFCTFCMHSTRMMNKTSQRPKRLWITPSRRCRSRRRTTCVASRHWRRSWTTRSRPVWMARSRIASRAAASMSARCGHAAEARPPPHGLKKTELRRRRRRYHARADSATCVSRRHWQVAAP